MNSRIRDMDLILLDCKFNQLMNSLKNLYDRLKHLRYYYRNWLKDKIIEDEIELAFRDNVRKTSSSESVADTNLNDRPESPPPRRVITPSAPTLSEILEVEEEMCAELESKPETAEDGLSSLLKSMEPRKVGIIFQSLTASDWKEILSLPRVEIVNSLKTILSELEQSHWTSSEVNMEDEMRNLALEDLPNTGATNDGEASPRPQLTENPEDNNEHLTREQPASEQREGIGGCFTPHWVFPAINGENIIPPIFSSVGGIRPLDAFEAFDLVSSIQYPPINGMDILASLQYPPINAIYGLGQFPIYGMAPTPPANGMFGLDGIPLYEMQLPFGGFGPPLQDGERMNGEGM